MAERESTPAPSTGFETATTASMAKMVDKPNILQDVDSDSTIPTAQADTPKAKAPVLSRTPVEVLVEVFMHLDMATAHSLAAANLRFATIFAGNRAAIVLRIAKAEFTPFDGLLQVVKASPADMCTPWGTWLDKRIQRKNTVLCAGGTIPEGYASRIPGPRATCVETQFGDWDVDKLLSVCRVVRGWERIFPQHRFNASPATTRSLSAREGLRLRRALYIWMRYAYYFHGDLPRPNVQYPAGRDVRVNQLRMLSNSQLSELKDLWMTVENIVELNVCPSVDNVRIGADFKLSLKDAKRIGWGKQRENCIVVATVRKLSPKELLFYIDNAHKYTKLRLIQDIRQRHAHFEADTESLSCALGCVINERLRQMVYDSSTAPVGVNELYPPFFGRRKSGGGILDWTNPVIEVNRTSQSEMAGLGLDWRPEEASFRRPPEIPTGMLNPS